MVNSCRAELTVGGLQRIKLSLRLSAFICGAGRHVEFQRIQSYSKATVKDRRKQLLAIFVGANLTFARSRVLSSSSASLGL